MSLYYFYTKKPLLSNVHRDKTFINSLRPSDAYICVSKLTIIGSDNGLSPGWCQAIIWTNSGILLIRSLGTNFSEILIDIYTFSFKEIHLKMSSEMAAILSLPQWVNLAILLQLDLMIWSDVKHRANNPYAVAPIPGAWLGSLCPHCHQWRCNDNCFLRLLNHYILY